MARLGGAHKEDVKEAIRLISNRAVLAIMMSVAFGNSTGETDEISTMPRENSLIPALLFLFLLSIPVEPSRAVEQAGEKPAAAQPKVDDLGDQRYRIRLIEVDKARQRFTVPGAVLRHEPPLEFVAATKGGSKAYESLLELGANAFEFNLACILIGLDAEKGDAPEPSLRSPTDSRGSSRYLGLLESGWQVDPSRCPIAAISLGRVKTTWKYSTGSNSCSRCAAQSARARSWHLGQCLSLQEL